MDDFDREKFEDDLRQSGIEYDPKAFKLGWLTRFLMRFSPALGFKLLNRRLGINNDFFDKAHELFSETESIHIFPYHSGTRGFMLVIDGKTALYFNQDGDHFKYDGFEMGEYKKGDITIFDGIKTEGPY